MTRQDERREATRAAILAAAQTLFGSFGYNHVAVDQIAAKAGVAKGAIYHHFATKAEVFKAVLRNVALQIQKDVQEAPIPQGDIFSALCEKNRAFFASCANPHSAQIFLRDGPSVLGWERWREVDASYFGGMIRTSLQIAMEMGVIVKRPIDPLVHLMLGAVTEAAIDCANSANFAETAEGYLDALEAILKGLRPNPAIE